MDITSIYIYRRIILSMHIGTNTYIPKKMCSDIVIMTNDFY